MINCRILGLAVATLISPSFAHAAIDAAHDPEGALLGVEASSSVSDKDAGKGKPLHRPAVKKHVAKKSVASPKSSGEVGLASWYGGPGEAQRTASGEMLDDGQLTAAHKTLPLHSRVRVTNLANGRSVTVRITDRGPHKKGRIIDLSQSAAAQLGMMHKGLARVRLQPLSPYLINSAG